MEARRKAEVKERLLSEFIPLDIDSIVIELIIDELEYNGKIWSMSTLPILMKSHWPLIAEGVLVPADFFFCDCSGSICDTELQLYLLDWPPFKPDLVTYYSFLG